MQTPTALLLNLRLIQSIRRTLRVPHTRATKTPSTFAFLCTQPDSNVRNETSEPKQEEKTRPCLSYKIEKLSKGEPVLSAFQSWMGSGFPVHRGDIFHAINRLRNLNMNKRALEVMEWVIRERPYKPRELDYSNLLHFTIRVHGISQGEKLFSRTPPEFRNELLYNNLVIACLDKGAIRLAFESMKKMREFNHPISHLVFNRLIILHSSPKRRHSVTKILSQMRADKVPPHVSTYNILLKIRANEHDIDGLMKVFGDAKSKVEPNEISYCIVATAHVAARLYTVAEAYVEEVEKSMTGKNWSTLDILIMLYGYLGKAGELERTWETVRNSPFVRSKSYILAIEAFGRIGRLERAEQLWLELTLSRGVKSTETINSVISVYCRHGLVEKASRLYGEIENHGCRPNAITYRHLALGCLKAGLVDEAVRTLEKGSEFRTNFAVRNSMPWLETTLSLVEAFAGKGDVGNAEKLFEELTRAQYSKYTFVCNALIKAYVKAKIYEPDLLKRMILGGARPDSETYSLMKLAEQYRK